MKRTLYLLTFVLIIASCNQNADKDKIRKEIYQAEKAFEKMAAEKGIEKAFYFYAADDAVILRENDTLIKGKDNIRNYYARKTMKNAKVKWTPDFIDVSDCGTLGYTYGKYIWKIANEEGVIQEFTGIFHTVWKKQIDNSWKYVWD
jgi:ketosteroid isomerase-like protein